MIEVKEISTRVTNGEFFEEAINIFLKQNNITKERLIDIKFNLEYDYRQNLYSKRALIIYEIDNKIHTAHDELDPGDMLLS